MNQKFEPVSVYMVHKGAADYIFDSLKSITEIVYPNFEFILIDDGIDANSRELYKRLFDSISSFPHRIVVNNGNGLISGCRTALENAKGRWIIRLDSDDMIDAHAISQLVNSAKSSQLDLIYPDYEEIDKVGRHIRIVRYQVDKVNLLENEFHGACCLARTDFLRDIGAYKTKAIRQDGFELLVKSVASHGKIGHLPEVLFKYRRHDNNISRNQEDLSKARNLILGEFLESRIKNLPKSALVLPFRNHANEEYVFTEIQNQYSLIELVLDDMSRARHFTHFVLVSQRESKKLSEFAKKFDANLIYVPDFISISESIEYLNGLPKLNNSIFVSATVNFPFRLPTVYDATLAKMMIFGYDQIFSAVRHDSNMYRVGNFGMEPLFPRNELRIRRDRVFVETGGIMGRDYGVTPSSAEIKVGNILISPTEAIEIRDELSINRFRDFSVNLHQ